MDTTELKRSSSRSPVCCQKEPHQRDFFCLLLKETWICFNFNLVQQSSHILYISKNLPSSPKPTSLWDIINNLSLKQPKCVSHKSFRYFPRFFCFPTCIFEKKKEQKRTAKKIQEMKVTIRTKVCMLWIFILTRHKRIYININSSQVSILTKAVLLLKKMTCVIILAKDDVDSLRVKTFY